jgi:hypothetical protein
VTEGYPPAVNVLTEEKKQQVIALGRLGWSLRRIQQATRIRRETATTYLKAAGVPVRPPGGWGHSQAKPAIEVSTDSGGGLGPVNSDTPLTQRTCVLAAARGRDTTTAPARWSFAKKICVLRRLRKNQFRAFISFENLQALAEYGAVQVQPVVLFHVFDWTEALVIVKPETLPVTSSIMTFRVLYVFVAMKIS